MALLTAELFSRLHSELLKSRGFKKVGNRSERKIGKLHQAIVLFSSRFHSAENMDFTLEYRVSHEDFFHLYFPDIAFPGLSEKFMPLLSWRRVPGVFHPDPWWHLSSANADAVFDAVLASAK